MKIPLCPLCNSRNNEKRFSVNGYNVLVCHVCELLFINPFPTDSDQVHHKISEYNYDELEIVNAEKHYFAEVQYYKKYFSLINEECKEKTSILDVGCGTGHLLERLKIYPDLFRTGIELNTKRAEIARKVSNCEINQVPIEKFSSKRKFDVITMINVLSHIPSFNNLFKSLRWLLKKKGKLILKVCEMRSDVKKQNVFDWGIPDHLHFLGLKSLEFICQKYNFKIIRYYSIPYSKELFSIYRWREPGRSNFRNIIKKFIICIPFSLLFLSKCYDIICGNKIYSSFIVLSPKS